VLLDQLATLVPQGTPEPLAVRVQRDKEERLAFPEVRAHQVCRD
jgi:hypothetical protein